jgi:hypothetical protein
MRLDAWHNGTPAQAHLAHIGVGVLQCYSKYIVLTQGYEKVKYLEQQRGTVSYTDDLQYRLGSDAMMVSG